MKKLPIGISDFRKVINGNNYFVDKSMLIYELINSNAEVSLIPRPRRFGKTLNLSMLKYFFEVEEDNVYLFKDLEIYKTNEFKKYINRYPVIFLSFKDIKNSSFKEALNKINYLIREEFKRYYKKLNIQRLDFMDKLDYLNILELKATKDNIESSIIFLSKLLYQKYNKKVIILIDEYDTPIHVSYLYGYYNDMIEFIRNLLSSAFKDNSYLFKGVITGILRVSRESIFSGLNNIAIYSILDYEYSDKFGFTIGETKKILNDFNLIDRYNNISSLYNGYKFGDNIIFNPWSIINFIGDKKHRLLPYWANTSSNDLIKHLLDISSLEFKRSVEIWLRRGSIRSVIDTNIVFPQIDRDDKNIYSLLFFSGYLKCLDKELINQKYYCNLTIPNREVEYIFENIVSNWVSERFQSNRLELLLKSLVNGDIETFEEIFSEIILETLSFYDVNRKNEEAVYHAFLLGILINLRDYEVISNREAGLGRVDIILLHKKDKDRVAIIMELKKINRFRENSKDKALENALKQIEKQKYEIEVRKRGYNNILKMGVVFDGKRVWVKRS